MREYMHIHVEDGKVFKTEDMQWKKMLPLNEYDALVFYGDLSYKSQACHKGMILIGKTGREFHIIYCFLRQQSRTVLAKWLYDLYENTELRNCRKVRYWIEGLFAMDEFVNRRSVPRVRERRRRCRRWPRCRRGALSKLNTVFRQAKGTYRVGHRANRKY